MKLFGMRFDLFSNLLGSLCWQLQHAIISVSLFYYFTNQNTYPRWKNKFGCIFPEIPLSNLALQYILSRDEVSTCIPGAKSIKQLESNVNATKSKINSKIQLQIKSIQDKWKD